MTPGFFNKLKQVFKKVGNVIGNGVKKVVGGVLNVMKFANDKVIKPVVDAVGGPEAVGALAGSMIGGNAGRFVGKAFNAWNAANGIVDCVDSMVNGTQYNPRLRFKTD